MVKRYVYGIKVTGFWANVRLIKEAIYFLRDKTPEFFWLVVDNIREIRQIKIMKIMNCSEKFEMILGRVPAQIQYGKVVEYPHILAWGFKMLTVACMLIHEATHLRDLRMGHPINKELEIRAAQAELDFLRKIEKIEGLNLSERIKTVEERISKIKKGLIYTELPA